ncbi:MAG: substrate-binding domain-containing protein [Phycisphaerales bacterium]|nr:substrate-binding domain-containing protein [Phycisphaerales bacterium]
MSGRLGAIVVGAAVLSLGAALWVIASVVGSNYSQVRTVTLYCSADSHIADPVIQRFLDAHGRVRVNVLGDTEATKTFGLVERLRAEQANPQANMFWSSEPFACIALEREGIVRGRRLFGARARAIVYNTNRVDASDAPKTMHELLDERFRGRIVMARPQFGTTRGHMAFLVAAWGEAEAQAYLHALKAQGARLLDGNSAVVRAVALGEADVGLTDTDDVYGAQRERLPVDMVYVRHDLPAGSKRIGPMVIPNTVALVVGHDQELYVHTLAGHLASPAVERMLAESDSHNMPMDPEVAKDFPQYAIPDPAQIPLEDVADAMQRAMELCERELGR